MKKVKINVEVEIPVDENNSDECQNSCYFVDGFNDRCLLFPVSLRRKLNGGDGYFYRCKQCLEATG